MDQTVAFEQIQARLYQAETLLQLNDLLTTTLDVAEVYRRAARAFTETLHLTRCVLFSWNREEETTVAQAEFVVDAAGAQTGQYVTDYQAYPLTAEGREMLATLTPHLWPLNNPRQTDAEQSIPRQANSSTLLGLPLFQQTNVIGLAHLYRAVAQPSFSDGDIAFAQAIAHQTAGALHNAGLATEANRRAAQLSILNRLSTAFASAPTLATVFDGAREEILSLLDATKLSIMLVIDNGTRLKWVYGYEDNNQLDVAHIEPQPIHTGLSGQVIQKRDVVLLNQELESTIRAFRAIAVGATPQVWLGIPLIVADKLIGVLSLENHLDSKAFSGQDLPLLKTIVGPLATTINSLVQFEELQAALKAQSEQRIQLQTAAEVAAATTDILALEDLIQKAVELINERFNLYYVGLFLIDTQTNFAVLKAGTGEAGKIQVERHHRLHVGGRSLIGGATFDGIPRITQDVHRDEEWRPNPTLPETRSELALPLRVRGRIIGAITVQSVEPNKFNDELIKTLLAMTDQMAVAIENAQLITEAQTRAEQQQKLNQVSSLLYSTSDVNTIISIGLKAISEHLHHAPVELFLGSPAPASDRS